MVEEWTDSDERPLMTTKVLLVEGDADEAAKVVEMLASSGHDEFLVEHAETVAAAKAYLSAGTFDAVLLDAGDSAAGRVAALTELVAAAATLPVVVLTERDDENLGAAALQAGAQDYLVKRRINGDVLRRVIRYSRERTRAQLAFEATLAEHGRQLERQVAERTSKLSQEIADRIRIETALRDSQHRIQAITDNLFEGVLVVDLDGLVTFSNRSAAALLGGNADDHLTDKHIDTVFTLVEGKQALTFNDSPFRHVAETGQVHQDDEAVLQTPSGRPLVVALACSPLIDAGKRMGAIISFRDIQAIKKAQQEALQASKLASVGQLAAGIAHEINTPTQYIGDNLRFVGDALAVVAPLLARCRALMEGDGASADLTQMREVWQAFEAADIDYLMQELPVAIGQSLEGVGQVSRIVLAMKEFSHPGEREKVAVNLNRAVENTLAVSRNEWKHVAEIDLDLDAGLPDIVCMPGEINQVLLNLIVNASHAIQRAKPAGKGRIAIATRRRGDVVDIVVADNGTGMSDEVKERIFDPFFTTKGVGMGTGQGLAICRDVVVNKHRGRIEVDSEEGRGATFTVTLPIGGVAPDEAVTP
jgi:PAS domain S-box-containing protein